MLIHIDTDELDRLAGQWHSAAGASGEAAGRTTGLLAQELVDVLLSYGIAGAKQLAEAASEVVAGGDGLLVTAGRLEQSAIGLVEQRGRALLLEGQLPDVIGWLGSHHDDLTNIYRIINGLHVADQNAVWWFQGNPIWKTVFESVKGPAGAALAGIRDFLGLTGEAGGFFSKVGGIFGKVPIGVIGKVLGPIGAAWNGYQLLEHLEHPKYGDDGVRNSLQFVSDAGSTVGSIWLPALVVPAGIWLGTEISDHVVPDAAHQGWHEISGVFTGKQGLTDLQDISTQADHQSSGGPLGWGSDRGKAEQFLRDQLHSYAVMAAVKTGNAGELGQLSEWIRMHGYPDDIWRHYHNVAQAIADGKASSVQTQADALQFIQANQ